MTGANTKNKETTTTTTTRINDYDIESNQKNNNKDNAITGGSRATVKGAVLESKVTTGRTHNDNTNDKTTNTTEQEDIVLALMTRSYHLPGTTSWIQDLVQYLINNHPVIGIWCHHPLHPVNIWERILALIGSALFGLIITNIIYLAFVFTDINYDTTYVEIPATNFTQNIAVVNIIESNTPAALSITNGNIALWTIGSTIHALYDNMIWQLAACTCWSRATGKVLLDKQERYKNTGTFLILFSVIVVISIATFVVTLRKALDGQLSSTENNTNQTALQTAQHVRVYKATSTIINPNTNTTITNSTTFSNTTGGKQEITLFAEIDSTQDLEFLVAYCIELALNYFVYYPIVGTILFSGIVTCFTGKSESFGGRPYELKQLELQKQEQQQEENQATRRTK